MNKLEKYWYTVKSEKSKETYEEYFRYFNEWSKMTVTDLLRLSQKKIQDKLIEYVISMRDRKLSNSSIKGRVAPIIKFLLVSGIAVNKEQIKEYYGEEKKTVKDEPYTTEDIQTMLSQAKLRAKVMILVYSSTGIRRDAIVDLKLKHLEKVPQLDLYKVTVYENSKEEYITFTTPETATMIDHYLKQRQLTGEKITKESYLIRNEYNCNRKDKSENPQSLTSLNLNTIMRQLLLKTGLRADKQPVYTRHNKMIYHAFRKYFTNKLIESGVNTECRWLLEGHALKGQDSSYVRISEQQLLQEYLKAVDNLTINEEHRLRKKVKMLEVEKSRLDQLELSLKRLEQRYRK